MKNKKTVILVTIIVIFSLIVGYLYVSSNKDEGGNININHTNSNNDNKELSKSKEIKFLESIAGIKAVEVELINNPVGIKGRFEAPKESILNGIDYFLKNTKNEKVDNVSIDIGNGYIDARANYKVNSFINTPIEVKVIPSINENKDLLLSIDEVRFLDLKLADWIVDLGIKNFVKDWFSKDSDISVEFNDGYVIIHSQNFKELTIENLLIDDNGLILDMFINLEDIM